MICQKNGVYIVLVDLNNKVCLARPVTKLKAKMAGGAEGKVKEVEEENVGFHCGRKL